MQGKHLGLGIAAAAAVGALGWFAGRASVAPPDPETGSPPPTTESPVVAPRLPEPTATPPADPAPSRATPPAAPSAADRFAAAWRESEIEGRVAPSIAAFREIADDASAPRDLRARALVAAARGARLLGRGDEAESLLRRAAEEFADVPEAAAEARRLRAQVTGTKSRWATGLAELRPGQFLDLDSGGAFTSPALPDGSRAELTPGAAGVMFLVRRVDDDRIAAAAGAGAAAPWWRVLTDLGRDAWVQVLWAGETPLVRFVVRVSGQGDVIGVPRDLRCIGYPAKPGPGRVRVRWSPDTACATWRVERRTGPDAPFADAGTVTSPEFEDTDVAPGVRHAWRIRGVSAGGDEGIPAVVQGTTASRGLVSGSLEIPYTADRGSVDLLTGMLTPGPGDLTLEATYGGASGASFLDSAGRTIRSDETGGRATSPWATRRQSGRREQIAPSAAFLVAVRGGGVARCRWEPPAAGGNGVRLVWEADPDSDVLLPAGNLRAEADGAGGIVRVEALRADFRVDTIRVLRDGASGGIELPVDGGVARDPGAVEGTVRDYVATPVDADGRRGPELRGRLDRRRDEATAGSGELHYQQGFSFERGAVVPREEADVWFETCAGGISSITFRSQGGIASLESVVGRDRAGAPGAATLLTGVLAARPDAVRLEASAQADSRTPESDVFLVLTRSGGWAKFAITDRIEDDGRSWQESPARIEYVWNPRSPTFAPDETGAEWVQGWRLARKCIPVGFRRAVSAGADERPSTTGSAGGSVPSSGAREEVLFSWNDVRDEALAVFDLEGGRRPLGRAQGTPPTADLRYGDDGDSLTVRCSSGGASITDLGTLAWETVAAAPLAAAWSSRAVASFDHVYVLRALTGTRGVVALLRVTALEPGSRLSFEWLAVRSGVTAASPGFDASGPLRAALVEQLRALAAASQGGLRLVADSPQARATLAVLDSPGFMGGVGGAAIRRAEAGTGSSPEERIATGALGYLVRMKTPGPLRLRIDPDVPRESLERPIHVRTAPGEVFRFREFVERVTRVAGICWNVEEDGTVVLVPLNEER